MEERLKYVSHCLQELLNEQNRQIRSEIDWSTMDTNGSDDTNKVSGVYNLLADIFIKKTFSLNNQTVDFSKLEALCR